MPSYEDRDHIIKKCRDNGRELSKESKEFFVANSCPFCGKKNFFFDFNFVSPNGVTPGVIQKVWTWDVNTVAECKRCHKKWSIFDASHKPDKNSYQGILRNINQSFFPKDEITLWRSFSGLDGWAIKEVHGFPNESRLFDAPIDSGNIAPSIRLTRVIFNSYDVSHGWLRATDRRLIVTNENTRDIFDILYDEIVGAYLQQEIVKLVLSDKSNILIYTKFPTVSLLNAVVMMGQSPVDATITAAAENQKQAIGNNFISSFTEFFNNIVDKNRGQ